MEYFKAVLLLVALLSTSCGRKNGKGRGRPENQCVLNHDGCSYEIRLTGTTCLNSMQGDGPAANRINETLKHTTDSDFETNNIIEISEDTGGEEEMSVKKLEVLEKKLVKMMEGLSIRSLRHIRQIRNDLRKMYQTISNLQGPESLGLSKGIECPSDFISVGTATSCYRFSTFATGWHDARDYCAAFGADLVAPDTLKESYILDYLIKSNPGCTSASFSLSSQSCLP